MTDEHVHLDDKSLNTLMIISFQSVPQTQHQIKVMVQSVRHIFAESM